MGEDDTEDARIDLLFLRASESQTELRQKFQEEAELREDLLFVMEDKSLSMSVFLERERRENLVENLNMPELEVIQKHLFNEYTLSAVPG